MNGQLVDSRPGVPLPDLERHLGADRLLQAVGLDLSLLRFAVDVDLHAGCPGRAVVGHEHVSPDTGRNRAPRNDLERVLGPVVDEMSRDAPSFEPHVPAPVVAAVVHAGDHRAE